MRNGLFSVKSFCLGLLVLILILSIDSAARAELMEEGMYFSILGVENRIEGDFEGTVTYHFVGTTILHRFPKIESGRGFGILIGGYKGKIAGELYYSCSNHDTSFIYSDLNGNGIYDAGEEAIYKKDGECQVIGGNIKYYFANLFRNNIRAFGELGIFVPQITMENGAYKEGFYYDTADVTFTGYGADLGLGVLIHLHPNLAVTAKAAFRYIRIREVTAFGKEAVPADRMEGTGRSYSIGLNYYF